MSGSDEAVHPPSSTPSLIASRKVHSGRVVDLSIDSVRFPDGTVGELEMIRHSGAAAVLPILDRLPHPDPRVVLIHQYRYAGGGYLYEVPAGRPHVPGEDWEICAGRELEEETGFVAGSIKRLTTILTTPGFTDERIHLFLATDLRHGTVARDVDEFMEPVVLPFSETIEMVHDGRILDAKTICTLLYANRFIAELRNGG